MPLSLLMFSFSFLFAWSIGRFVRLNVLFTIHSFSRKEKGYLKIILLNLSYFKKAFNNFNLPQNFIKFKFKLSALNLEP